MTKFPITFTYEPNLSIRDKSVKISDTYTPVNNSLQMLASRILQKFSDHIIFEHCDAINLLLYCMNLSVNSRKEFCRLGSSLTLLDFRGDVDGYGLLRCLLYVWREVCPDSCDARLRFSNSRLHCAASVCISVDSASQSLASRYCYFINALASMMCGGVGRNRV